MSNDHGAQKYAIEALDDSAFLLTIASPGAE
jgi:hypothetical protein